MALQFDSEGKLSSNSTPTSDEIAGLQAYVSVVVEPKEGFSLSQLRAPGSAQSLQSLERTVNALVSSGFLSVTVFQNKKGIAYKKYHKVSA